MQLYRYWIDQPSTLQPLHEYHGRRVFGEEHTARLGGRVYFADNTPLFSIEVPKNVLSDGWPP